MEASYHLLFIPYLLNLLGDYGTATYLSLQWYKHYQVPSQSSVTVSLGFVSISERSLFQSTGMAKTMPQSRRVKVVKNCRPSRAAQKLGVVSAFYTETAIQQLLKEYAANVSKKQDRQTSAQAPPKNSASTTGNPHGITGGTRGSAGRAGGGLGGSGDEPDLPDRPDPTFTTGPAVPEVYMDRPPSALSLWTCVSKTYLKQLLPLHLVLSWLTNCNIA